MIDQSNFLSLLNTKMTSGLLLALKFSTLIVSFECFVKIGQVLVGKEFCVIDGPSNFPKQELETNIVQLGGTVVQNPGKVLVSVLSGI